VITRRIFINLVSFLVLSAALVAYGFLDLLGNPLADAATVSTVLPTASGLSKNFVVTLDGVEVGAVSDVSLVPQGAKVTITLNPGAKVPNDVASRVVVANALGQQELELVPQRMGAAPNLKSGDVVPAAADSTPADVGTVVAEATRLLQAIPAGDLDTVIHNLALALDGNGQNLRTIANASELFSQEFLAYEQQFQSLLANAPPVLDTLTQNAAALRQGLADTAVLAQTLANRSPDVVRLLTQGTSAATALNSLVVANEPNLACLTHDLADVNANLAQRTNLANLATTLATNEWFFGAVAGVAPSGPAKALTSGDNTRNNQEWLRTMLLLPPGMPPGDSYTQALTLPPVLPGAACSTEFGQGVGPGVQANFRPAGPNAKVEMPTAAQAHVSGGGAAPNTAPAVARLHPGAEDGVAALPLIGGAAVLGWVFTMGRRRAARSARPVRVLAPGRRRRTA